MRRPWFSVTREQFRFDTFRSGGKGGQNQNKVESGVRCVHELSGATGEARDSRDQPRNRIAAFKRCVESQEFQSWLRNEIARRLGKPTVDEIVDAWMRDENLRIEFGCAAVAQTVEHRLRNPEVGGSNPPRCADNQ